MGDPLRNCAPNGSIGENRKKVYNRTVVDSCNKPFLRTAYKSIASLGQSSNGGGAVGQVAIFLLKVAALETVRRVSRSKCPPLWRGVQALQFLCLPPFKWIRRWAPFKGLIGGLQMFSRPLLLLSVATAFTDQLDDNNVASDSVSGSHAQSEEHSQSPSTHSSLDLSNDGFPQSLPSENWLMQIHKELENQGITLPERLNEDELRRFYTAANGDFSCLLLSIKKTIRWRETYRILSEEELEMWSNMIFWHGFDVQDRPCLIVRLGLACIELPSHERPRFAQAVISQVEHGILHLVDQDNPHITVIVDCDGISPLRIPMKMMRSCSTLLQDNFPNRLGNLVVIRLPPVVRVIAQTFIQVMKPVTRKKLRIEGSMYQGVLSEYLQILPAYLGGNCACKICSAIGVDVMGQMQSTSATRTSESNGSVSNVKELPSPQLSYEMDMDVNDNWDHLLRTAVIGLLMVWAFIALLAGIYDPSSRPF